MQSLGSIVYWDTASESLPFPLRHPLHPQFFINRPFYHLVSSAECKNVGRVPRLFRLHLHRSLSSRNAWTPKTGIGTQTGCLLKLEVQPHCLTSHHKLRLDTSGTGRLSGAAWR